ncbi:hypothetical protein NDU88_003656 [Pleurodeles waltl]|uniref:Uncharacterized protein n=1 Tax=Pleurodeles waltl TaxID=8319 RepID=A0AAV7PDA2_PLEWA|nr:hypothetical protein NDU88_003656 [Pleurodeles waltl]
MTLQKGDSLSQEAFCLMGAVPGNNSTQSALATVQCGVGPSETEAGRAGPPLLTKDPDQLGDPGKLDLGVEIPSYQLVRASPLEEMDKVIFSLKEEIKEPKQMMKEVLNLL